MAAVSQEYTSGYAGAVSVDATALPVTSWNGTLSCPSFDATNSTSSGWQKRLSKPRAEQEHRRWDGGMH